MEIHIFSEIAFLVAVAAGVSIVMRLLRQPLIIGYIITGLLVGPAVFSIVKSPETLGLLGEFGIALLLFIVGLGLNPSALKEVGRVALFTGLGQVIFTTAIGFLIVVLIGYDAVAAFYIAVALAFSSTIIILKLLSDKKEQNKLYGKISIGFLLVQDIIAATALVVAATMGNGGFNPSELAGLALRGLVLFAGVFLLSLLISKATGFLSKSQEMLFLFTLAWGFGVAALSLEIGFSLEVGALFAGVALASKSYAQEMSSRLRPLRDFFIIVFFISLGSGLNVEVFGDLIWQAVGLSTFVLIGNPIIVMIIMGVMGYTRQTGFKAGLTVAQISEFSLIFVLLGASTGQLGEEVVALVTMVGIITIALSTYMITYSDQLYKLLEKYLRVFERRRLKDENDNEIAYDAVLFGYDRGGASFVKLFRELGYTFVVVDYNPDSIKQMKKRDIPCIFGDATDIELLESIAIDNAKIMVSMITNSRINKELASLLARMNSDAVKIFHGATISQAEALYELGASYVMLPHYIGTEHITSLIKLSNLDKKELLKYKNSHLLYLKSQYE